MGFVKMNVEVKEDSMKQPFKVVQRDSFRVLGFVINTTNKRSEGKKVIPAHWENFKQNDLQETLMSKMDHEPLGVFGINVYNIDEKDSRKFDYYIAASSSLPETKDVKEYIVPANTWAVFPCTVDTIGKTEVQAITKWLPKSNYKPLNSGYITGRMKSGAPDIEYYGKDGIVEVWVAVKEK